MTARALCTIEVLTLPIMPMPPVWTLHAERGFDAIGWTGLMSDPKYGCITPPPFGQQCTLPRAMAIAACMAMEGCVAITCPDPLESHIGTRGITGPVCQLRSKRMANEKGHGMCQPGGCINVGVSRIRRMPMLKSWEWLGVPFNASFSNAALVLFHAKGAERERLAAELLPEGQGRYWPLRRGVNSGMGLFAVDAMPPMGAATSGSHRGQHHRHDLWVSERGGGADRRDSALAELEGALAGVHAEESQQRENVSRGRMRSLRDRLRQRNRKE